MISALGLGGFGGKNVGEMAVPSEATFGPPGAGAGAGELASQPVVLYPDAQGPLGSLAALAGTSFASDEEATAAVLREVAGQLGMRTSFLTQIAGGKNRVVVAHNEPGGSGIAAGTILPLAHTY